MKNIFLKISTLFLITIALISCKNTTNEAATTEAQEVATPEAAAQAFVVDVTASKIDWVGSKPLEKHTGTINLSGGRVMVKDDVIEAGKFIIDMNSIAVTDLEGDSKANLENHLKGTVEGKEDHFFNVVKFPQGLFELTGVELMDGKAMVKGNLTLRDISYNVSFPAVIEMMDNGMTLTSEPFSIDRTKWGVNYGSKSVFDDLGDKFINDDIELTVSLVAKKA